jgi:hypothetical protein
MTVGWKNGPGAAALGTGVAVVLAMTCGLSPRSCAEDPGPAAQPNGRMRCPECGLEMPWGDPPKRVLCPHCGQKKVVMEFSVPGQEPARDFLANKRFPLIMVGTVGVLAIAVAVLGRGRVARRAKEQEVARRARLGEASREEIVRYEEQLRYRAARLRKRRR